MLPNKTSAVTKKKKWRVFVFNNVAARSYCNFSDPGKNSYRESHYWRINQNSSLHPTKNPSCTNIRTLNNSCADTENYCLDHEPNQITHRRKQLRARKIKKKLNLETTPHPTATSGVPSSFPWISRWFSLTKVFSLAGVVATGSIRLEGEPTLLLVEADWQPDKAGVPKEALALLLLPSFISEIA